MPELIHPPDTHKLGKLAPKAPRRMIRDFVDVERALPQAPATVDNTRGGTIPLGMYLNDRYGCCTCSAIGNFLRVVSAGAEVLSDTEILVAYEAVTAGEGAAFDPGPPPVNDNGAAELDVLDLWAKPGGVGGNVLLGHAGVDMTDPDEHRVITWLFGGVYLGLALAVEQQSQHVWDYVPGSSPGSWGGHAVPESAAGVQGAQFGASGSDLIVVETWQAYKCCTPAFLYRQADEGHALVTQEWCDASRENPLVNVAALEADLGLLQPEA